jgi:pyridoxine 4-dehydrogenase
LRLERIDLYQLHSPDPDVPFVDSIGALAELRRVGKIRHIGISNVSVAQLELARSVTPIVSVQNMYNLRNQTSQDVLSLAWLLAKSPVILPIPGTRSIDHLEANVLAAALKLGPDNLDDLG